MFIGDFTSLKTYTICMELCQADEAFTSSSVKFLRNRVSLLKRGFVSSIILVAEKFFNRLVGLASTLILARLLTPEDFGIVAIAVLIVGVVEVLAKTNGGAYLMRFEEITPQMLNTAFTIDISLKALVALGLVASSPFIADFYDDSRLTQVIVVFAAMTFMGAWINPGLVLLRKQQRYEKIVKVNMFGKIISACIAVYLAYMYETFWALVIGKLVQAAFSVGCSYFISDHRPFFTYSNAGAQAKFSGWLIPQALMSYFRNQIDTLIVSTDFGKAQLGAYSNMKYFSFLPAEQVIQPAIVPLYAQLAGIRETSQYYNVRSNVSLFFPLVLALFVSFIMSTHSEVIVELVLGKQWIDYANLFAIFSYSLVPFVFSQHANRAMLLHGFTKLVALYELCCLLIVLSTLTLVSFDSLATFAKTKLALECAFALVYFIFTMVKYQGVKSLLSFLTLSLTCTTSLIVAAFSITQLLPVANSVFDLTIFVLFFTLAYSALCFLWLWLLKGILAEAQYSFEMIMRIKRFALRKIYK